MSIEKIISNYKWHQRWEIEKGVYTNGRNPVSLILDKLNFPKSLNGCSVLDVGAWNGCYSFECERRGADRVVAVDLWDPAVTGFSELKLYINSSVEYHQSSVYDLSKLGDFKFDYIIFFGVLYHLRHPILALDNLRKLCKGKLYLETNLLTNRLLFSKLWLLGLIFPVVTLLETLSVPFIRYYDAYECHPQDPSNWFGFNSIGVIKLLDGAGFSCELKKTWRRDLKSCNRRGGFIAKVLDDIEFTRMEGTQEAMSPLNSTYHTSSDKSLCSDNFKLNS